MSLLIAEAEKLSNSKLEAGVLMEIYTSDDLFRLFPFMRIEGESYNYNREATLSGGAFIDPYEDVPEGAATFTKVTSNVTRFAGQAMLDNLAIEQMSDVNSQWVTQLQAKAKQMGRQFAQTLVIGDSGSNAKEFDGIKALVTDAQTMAAGGNGAALTLPMLDELLDMVPLGADFLMMRSGTIRALRSLLRATGGVVPSMIMHENFDQPILAYNGVPVIKNDWLPQDETKGSSDVCTSIYAARLNEADGLHGIYVGPNAGLRFEDLGKHQTKDVSTFRLKWYAGTALKSTLSLARLEGVTNI